MFAYVRGFSKLSDRNLLWYFNVLHPVLAAVINKHRNEIEHLETWGDAIHLITAKASTAAQVAMEINDALATIDQSSLGLTKPLLLRIGLHYGPTYKLYDHFAQKYTYSSSDVIKAARIEPVTPPGEIFGTEPFVAMLEIEDAHWAAPVYAGTISSAKNFGAFRMFHIRPKYRDSVLMCSLA
ncbi:MAG: adenylate/guanylate cyclase domain-containing protein [Gallionellaceae bacterium]|nr:adenylate/guanylate cyclase domain-containing protein [Gallionellaceae bacterium]